jgi:Asp-tRNA(Asn)/Glu-tRNA(Gln) amidotransferase A subunit family amidase
MQEWAAELDELEPSKRGPLHGIPVSVKDNFGLAGYDCTFGLGKRLGHPSPTDAVLITTLKSLGAVPFCRTNIPQTLIRYNSVLCSFIYY